MINQIICGDCLEVMKCIPDKSVDLVLTDPPYNVGKQFGEFNEGKIFDKEFHTHWLNEAKRIINPYGGGVIYVLGRCAAPAGNDDNFRRYKTNAFLD